MTVARPCRMLDAAELENWAQKYAPHHFDAYELSDSCEYMDFWEWLDLTHPGVLGDFESWYRTPKQLPEPVADGRG